jgi:NADP-dependent aldehyde dehydrogenase
MFSFLGKNLIGYRYLASGSQFFFGINPKTNAAFEQKFISATSHEVNEAAEMAAEAFHRYARLSIESRLRFIAAIVQGVENQRSELLFWFQQETGLPEDRANTELNRSIFQFQNYAEALSNGQAFRKVINEGDPKRTPTPKPDFLKFHLPLGPVVVFGASNFPFAYSVLGGDVASALVAGCSVIVKGHAMHPHTSALSAEIIRNAAEKTEMPEGVFSHLQDAGFEVGTQLVIHPKVKAVGFTGSISGGRALMDLAAKRLEPIPVYAEMGSVNPIVMELTSENTIEPWSELLTKSVSLNAGQFCTSPGFLFLVNSSLSQRFEETLKSKFQQISPQTMLHPGIVDRFKARVEAHQQITETLVPVTFEGNAITPGLAKLNRTIFLSDPKSREELFGSFLTIVEVDSMSECLECLQVFEGQLTASVFTQEETIDEDLLYWLSRIAGRIILNGVPTGVEVTQGQQHGGPYPSSSQPYFTAVGCDAIQRFMRPVSLQNFSGMHQKLLDSTKKS